MSQFIKFYITSSVLNMFRTLIHPSSGACGFSIVLPLWRTQYFAGDKIEKNEMGWACGAYG